MFWAFYLGITDIPGDDEEEEGTKVSDIQGRVAREPLRHRARISVGRCR